MKKELLYFTAGQFSKLHHLNKRTLHYYDDIGLFSPAYKPETDTDIIPTDKVLN